MRTHVIPGGAEGECLPDGTWISLNRQTGVVLVGHYTETRKQLPPTPAGAPLYTRLSPHTRYLAGQGHQDGQAWEWNGAQWTAKGPAHGVNPCLYTPQGLIVATPAQGSQGYRYWDGRAYTGDETYGDGTYAQWTRRGSVTVGQAASGFYGLLINGRVLHEGRTELGPRFHREGSSLAIAVWDLDKGTCFYWLDEREIASLPVPNPGTNVPNPGTPPPPQEPPVSAPDWTAFYDFLHSKWSALPGHERTPGTLHALVYQWAQTPQGAGFGLLHKPGGANHNGYSEDWILQKLPNGSVWGTDVIVSMGLPTSSVSRSQPTPEPNPQNWRPAPKPDGDSPAPAPTPIEPGQAPWAEDYNELKAKLMMTRVQVSEQGDAIAALREEVSALAEKCRQLDASVGELTQRKYRVVVGRTWSHSHDAKLVEE